MAPRRTTSAETAARFLALRGEPHAAMYGVMARVQAKRDRLQRARAATAALTTTELGELLVELIDRYHNETTGAPSAKEK